MTDKKSELKKDNSDENKHVDFLAVSGYN